MPSLAITRHAEPPGPGGWAELARELGTFYHDPRWITGLAEWFGYELCCLSASDGGRLVGGLALAAVPELLGGKRLVSFPFSFIAGPMARAPEVARALGTAARELAAQRGARRLEIKQLGTGVSAAPPPPLPPPFPRATPDTTHHVSDDCGGQAG